MKAYAGNASRIVSVLIAGFVVGCGGGGGGGGGTTQATMPQQGNPSAVVEAPPATTSYMTVKLDGTASSDSSSTLSTYQWSQTAGPSVTISNSTTAQASFIAPKVSSASTLTVQLTVKDQLGTTNAQSANIMVYPPSPTQLVPSVLAFRWLKSVSGNPHLDAVPLIQTPIAGTSVILQVAMTGALQTPTFTFEDVNGKSLGTAALSAVGDSSQQPLYFIGNVTVPSVPFQIVASGTTADGRNYSLSASDLIPPPSFGISFNLSHVRLTAAHSVTVEAAITNNGGSAVTLIAQIVDPAGLDPSQTALGSIPSVNVPAGATTTMPFTLTYPATPPVAVSAFQLILTNAANSQAAFAQVDVLMDTAS